MAGGPDIWSWRHQQQSGCPALAFSARAGTTDACSDVWNLCPSRALLLPSFEDAAHSSARLKPCPDTNPSGFTFSHVYMTLSVMTEPSSHIRDDDVFLQEHFGTSGEHL
jgi:hypothetical protein